MSTNLNKEEILEKVNEVLPIMHKAELEAYNMFDKNLLYPRRKFTPTYHYVSDCSIKEDEKFIILKEQMYECGERFSKTYKVPKHYFNISEEEIYKLHLEWSKTEIKNRLEKVLNQKLENYKNKINYYEKEYGKLQEVLRNL